MTDEPGYFRQDISADVVDALTKQRVLVTGGHGFLGRYVVSAFRQAGALVLAPTSQRLNLTDQPAVTAYLQREKPDHVIHLAAACGGIGANIAQPARFLYENALMGLVLLEQARLAGVQKFVLISTTCAYPQDAPLPLQEDSIWDGPPTGATGPYGMAKRLLHEAVATYHHQYGFEGNVLIPANLYGPEDHFDPENSHVVAAMIRRYCEATARKASEVVNWGSGSPTREFLHVRDAAQGILRAAAFHRDTAPVNLGTGTETSIRELAELIAHAAGYEGNIEWDTSKPDGQPRRFLNVDRARAFGFNAQILLPDGLRETIDWYKTAFR